MKGLLVKDFLGMRSYMLTCFAIMLVLLVFINLGGAQDAAGFTVGCCALLGGMMAPASFTYDNQSGWDKYVLSLPYTKKQVVLSKYLLGLLTMGISAAAGVLLNLLFAALGIAAFGTDSLQIAVAIICGTAIVIGITMPLIYKFGTEKGRFVVIAISVPGFMIMAKVFTALQAAGLRPMLDTATLFLPLIATLVLILSYRITYKVYDKEEAPEKEVVRLSL